MAGIDLDLEDILNAIDDDAGTNASLADALVDLDDDALLASVLRGSNAPIAARPQPQQQQRQTIGISSLLRGVGSKASASTQRAGSGRAPGSQGNAAGTQYIARPRPTVQQPAPATLPQRRDLTDDEILAELLAEDSDDDELDADIAAQLHSMSAAVGLESEAPIAPVNPRLASATETAAVNGRVPSAGAPSSATAVARHHGASLVEQVSRRSSIASDSRALDALGEEALMDAALKIANKYAREDPARDNSSARDKAELDHILAHAQAAVTVGAAAARPVSHREAIAAAASALQAATAAVSSSSPSGPKKGGAGSTSASPATPAMRSPGAQASDDVAAPSRGHRPMDDAELDLEAIIHAYSGVATATPAQPSRPAVPSTARSEASATSAGKVRGSPQQAQPQASAANSVAAAVKETAAPSPAPAPAAPARPAVVSSPVERAQRAEVDVPIKAAEPQQVAAVVPSDPRTALVLHSSSALQRASSREHDLLKSGNMRIVSPLASRRRFRPRLPAHVLRAQARAKQAALASRGLVPFQPGLRPGGPASRRGSLDSGTGSITSASVWDGAQGQQDDSGLPSEWAAMQDNTALTGILTCGRRLVSWHRPGSVHHPSLVPPAIAVAEDGSLQAGAGHVNILPSVMGILRLDVLPGASDVVKRSVKALTAAVDKDKDGAREGKDKGALPISLGLPTAMASHPRFLAVGTSRSVVMLFDTASQELKAAFNARGNVSAHPATLSAAASALGISAGGAAVGAAGAAAVGATDGAVTAIDVVLPAPGSAPGGPELLAVGYQSGRVALWSLDLASPGKSVQLRVAEGFHKAPIVALRFTLPSPTSPVVLSADGNGVVNFLSFSRMLGLRWSVEAKCVLDGTKTGPITALAVLLPPPEERQAQDKQFSTSAIMAAAFTANGGNVGQGPSGQSNAPPYGTLVALCTRDATYLLVTAPELAVVHKWPRPEGVPEGVVPALAWSRARVHGGAPIDALEDRRAAAAATHALMARGPAAAVTTLDRSVARAGSISEGPGRVSPPMSRRSSMSVGTEASNNPFMCQGETPNPSPVKGKGSSGVLVKARSFRDTDTDVGSTPGVGGRDEGQDTPYGEGQGDRQAATGTLRRAAAADAYRQASTLPLHGVITSAPLPVLARAWGGHLQLLQVQPPGGYPAEQTNLGQMMAGEPGWPGSPMGQGPRPGMGPAGPGPMPPGAGPAGGPPGAGMPGPVPRLPPVPPVPTAAAAGALGPNGSSGSGNALFGSLTSTLMNVGGLDGTGTPVPGPGGPPGHGPAPTRALDFVLADDVEAEEGSYLYGLAWLGEAVLAYTATGGSAAAPDRLVLFDTAACEETDAVELAGLRVVSAPMAPAPVSGNGSGPVDPLAALPASVRTRLSSAHSCSISSTGDGQVTVLATDKVLTARLQRWTERAAAMVAQGEWLSALALALDTHDAVTSAHAANLAAAERQAKFQAMRAAALAKIAAQSGATIAMGQGGSGPPANPEQAAAAAALAVYDPAKWDKIRTAPGPASKGSPLGDELAKMLLHYLTDMALAEAAVSNTPELAAVLAMLPPLRRSARTGGRSANEMHWTLLAAVALDYCTTINRHDLLFGEVFERFSLAGRAAMLLEACEPYILAERLPAMPPSVLKSFVEHYRAQGALASVERCLLHLDLAALDVDGAVRTCSRFRLYSALIYVLNRGLLDFTLPVDLLLSAVFDEQAGSAGLRVPRPGQPSDPPSRKASLDYLEEAGPDNIGALVASPDPKAGKGSAAANDREVDVLPMSPAERTALGYAVLLYIAYCLTGRSFPHGKKALVALAPLLPEGLATTIADMHHAMAIAAQYGAAGMAARRGSAGDARRAGQGKDGKDGGKAATSSSGQISTWDLLFAPPEQVAAKQRAMRSKQAAMEGRAREAMGPRSPQNMRYGGARPGPPQAGPARPPAGPKQQSEGGKRPERAPADDQPLSMGPTPASIRSDMLLFLFKDKPDRFPCPAASMLASSGLLAGAAACSELPGPYPRLQAFLRFDPIALLAIIGRMVTEASDTVMQAIAMSEGQAGLKTRRACLPGDAPRIKVPPVPPGLDDRGPDVTSPSAATRAALGLGPILTGLAQAAQALALAAGYRSGGRDSGDLDQPSVKGKGGRGAQPKRLPAWCEPRYALVSAFISHALCRLGPGMPSIVEVLALPEGALEDVLLWLASPPPTWTGPMQLELLAPGMTPSAASARQGGANSRVTACPVRDMQGIVDVAGGSAQGVEAPGISIPGPGPSDPLMSDPVLSACLHSWELHSDEALYGRKAHMPTAAELELSPYGGRIDGEVIKAALAAQASLQDGGSLPWTREVLLVRLLRTVSLPQDTLRMLLERARAADLQRATAVLCALLGDAPGVVDAYLRCPETAGSPYASPSRVFRFIRAFVSVVSVGLGGTGGATNPLDNVDEEPLATAGPGATPESLQAAESARQAALATALLGPSVEADTSHERALALACKAYLMADRQGAGGMATAADSRTVTLTALPPSASASALRALRTHVMRTLPKLVAASESSTASLVIDIFPEKSDEVISSLERFPHMQYAYLRQFLRKAGVIPYHGAKGQGSMGLGTGSGTPTVAAPSTPVVGGGPAPVSVSADIHLRYIDLLCQYDPGAVLSYLTATSGAGYSLEGSLALVRDKHNLPGPTAFLLERTGDVRGAQDLGLRALDDTVAGLTIALRNAALAGPSATDAKHGPAGLDSDNPAPLPTALHVACSQEVQAVWSALTGAVALCTRCSSGSRFNDSESERLWLALLDRLVDKQMEAKGDLAAASAASAEHEALAAAGRSLEDAHAKNIAASLVARYSKAGPGAKGGAKGAKGAAAQGNGAPQPTASMAILLSTRAGAAAASTACTCLLVTLSSCLRCVLDGMKGLVPLNVVMAKVLSQHSAAELSEFGDTVEGMLSGYAFDVKVLGTANNLMAGDLYTQVKRLHGGYQAGVAPSKARGTCSACSMRLYSGGRGADSQGDAPSGKYVMIFGCGHAFHEACAGKAGQRDDAEDGPASGCPLCSQGEDRGRAGDDGDADGEPAVRSGKKGKGQAGAGRRAVSGAILGRAAVFGSRTVRSGTGTGDDEQGEGQGDQDENKEGPSAAFTADDDADGDVYKQRLAAVRARRARAATTGPAADISGARARQGSSSGTSYMAPGGKAGLAGAAVLHTLLQTGVPASSRNDGRKVVRRGPQELKATRDAEPLFRAGLDVSPFDFESLY